MNPYLILSGIGMLLVGAIAPFLWWWKKKIEAKFFLYGLILWVVAIFPKFIMDLTLTNYLSSYLKGFGDAVYVILAGLYVGLRTGLLEGGLPYLIILKTKIKEVNLNQAIAVGIGFGSIEALFLGFSSFMSILLFILYPDLIDKMPASQREIILQQLNQPSIVIPAPVMERTFALIIHIFAILLIFYAIRKAGIRYLAASVLYKTVADGSIPAFKTYIDLSMPQNIYLVELYFGILALIGLLGIEEIMERWR